MPKEVRGTMVGFFALFGGIGDVICLKGGDALMNKYGPNWIFVLVGGCNLGILLIVLILMAFGRFEKKKEQPLNQ